MLGAFHSMALRTMLTSPCHALQGSDDCPIRCHARTSGSRVPQNAGGVRRVGISISKPAPFDPKTPKRGNNTGVEIP